MTTTIKERPILFSGPMVRAILEGRKTQTRRIVKCDFTESSAYVLGCHKGVWGIHRDVDSNSDGDVWRCRCPYGVPGDRLWVRETWCQKCEDGYPVYNAENNLDSSCCWYRADGTDVRCDDGNGGTKFNKDGSESSPWSPSIHMPRWASRITLEITGVRVERLNEISEADAYSEGVNIPSGQSFASNGNPELRNEARCAFQSLWNSINGPGSWDANPFVWVLEFKKVTP